MSCFSIIVIYLLIFSQTCVMVLCAIVNERFYLRPEFGGKGCPSNDIAFTTTVPSKTICTGMCSQSSICKCVSYNSVDNTCIGCTGIYNFLSNFLDRPGHIFYESQIHEDDCVGSSCQNGATCVDALSGYSCTCMEGWTGTHCETDVDECNDSPCQNGATCLNGQNEYTCTCASGWTGTNCDIDVDECSSYPCMNGASCTHGLDQYSCTCVGGWTGTNCDTDVNECNINPCQNGATCVNGQNEYTCNCDSGWTGTNCDIDVDECNINPCQNGATCVNGQNEYTCNCGSGWTGTNCDIDADECASSPCKNGASCTNGFDQYTCTCASGWTGTDCDQDVDECSSSPCMNGGTCLNGVNAYTCSCASGWTGENCDQDVDECSSSPCMNGGTCLNGVNAYTCNCASGWAGENCDQGLAQTGTGSHTGTEFITGFMTFGLYNDGIPHLLIVSSAATSTNVWVTIPHLGINQQHHVLTDFLYLEYSNTLLPAMSSQVTATAVEVTSDQAITLYTVNYKPGLVDGTVELPTPVLGQMYIVHAHAETANGMAQILVIATTDNTAVTLYLPSGSTVNKNLNKYDVYQYRMTPASGPLAGTTISANNPVAVRVGHSCANVPSIATVYCEFLVTSVPSVETLGRVFVVPYQKSREDYSIGVSAPHDGTQITIWDIGGNELESVQLSSHGSIFRSYYSSKVISITSTQDILVIQYGHGSANTGGDPSAMIVPAVKQFTSSYDFVVPDVFSATDVISVIIDVSYGTSGLMLNGSPASMTESHMVIIPGMGSFNVVYINVNSGIKYTLTHLNSDAKFGAVLYARTSNSEYTTVLGYNL